MTSSTLRSSPIISDKYIESTVISMQNLSDWLLYSAYEGVKVKVADEASTPLMLNSGTIYFSYNIHAVTCVVTWSVCDGRPSWEAGAASQTDSRDVKRGTCRADVDDYIELNRYMYIIIFLLFLLNIKVYLENRSCFLHTSNLTQGYQNCWQRWLTSGPQMVPIGKSVSHILHLMKLVTQWTQRSDAWLW